MPPTLIRACGGSPPPTYHDDDDDVELVQVTVSGRIGGYLSCLGRDGSVGREGGAVAWLLLRPTKYTQYAYKT